MTTETQLVELNDDDLTDMVGAHQDPHAPTQHEKKLKREAETGFLNVSDWVWQ